MSESRSLDGTRFPFVQDLDGKWHRRPPTDTWKRSLEGPNASTVCGLVVPSVHVSAYDPRTNEDRWDDETFCECTGPQQFDGCDGTPATCPTFYDGCNCEALDNDGDVP